MKKMKKKDADMEQAFINMKKTIAQRYNPPSLDIEKLLRLKYQNDSFERWSERFVYLLFAMEISILIVLIGVLT